MAAHRLLTIASLAATAVAMPGAASAQAPVTAANPSSVAEALRQAGFGAEQSRDDQGNPQVRATMDQLRFGVFFFGCTNGLACETVQFHLRYTEPQVNAQQLNEWNRTRRWGRAFIDTNGDAVVEMDVNISRGGASRALFGDVLEYWRAVVLAFGGFVYPR